MAVLAIISTALEKCDFQVPSFSTPYVRGKWRGVLPARETQ